MIDEDWTTTFIGGCGEGGINEIWQDSASGGSCWLLGLYVTESLKLIKSIIFGILIVALISKSILRAITLSWSKETWNQLQ